MVEHRLHQNLQERVVLQNPLRGPRTGAKWRCVERVEFVDVGCVGLAAADHSSHCALSQRDRYYAASVFVLYYYSASVCSHCALSQQRLLRQYLYFFFCASKASKLSTAASGY